MPSLPSGDPRGAVTEVWRAESPRLVGALYRLTRDLDLAEDVAADALVAALEQWPAAGVPANPGAWLTSVAKRRAVDHFRRAQRLDRVQQQLGHDLAGEEATMPDPGSEDLEQIEDDVLRLMLVACHPVLTPESQVALTLRLLGGLSTREIARSFMVPEPTVVRRITRAKRSIEQAHVPFEVPGPEDRAERLPSVLHVIYLIFTEGYAATAGDDLLRPALCDEAIRLGRLVARYFPDDPEVHGLLALLQLQASRATARVDAAGDPVLLADQDRRLWDQLAVRRGLESLHLAFSLGGPVGNHPVGVYTVQAAIAACHAQAVTAAETDWTRIAGLYDRLATLTPSPVVRLNRAIAHGMAFGPAAGLDLVQELTEAGELAGYHLLPSVRGDLLAKLGRGQEARAEFEAAAALARNNRERGFLLNRARTTGTNDLQQP